VAKTVEQGLNDYLKSLNDKPTKQGRIVDKEAIKVLNDQIKAETEPLAKLRLLAARDEERRGKEVAAEDNSGLEVVFVQSAKDWAEANNITASNFLAMKVPSEVLVKAGFSLPADFSKTTRKRATRTSVSQAKVDAALKVKKPWTLKAFAKAAGIKNEATARNYVNKAVKDGKVKIAGDAPKTDGQRGRAAKLYAAK